MVSFNPMGQMLELSSWYENDKNLREVSTFAHNPTTIFGLGVAVVVVVFFLEPHLRHKEDPSLGVRSELQLLAYTTATARQDPSCIFNLHQSSQQHWILNSLSTARDPTCILMDASCVHNPLNHNGNSPHSRFEW